MIFTSYHCISLQFLQGIWLSSFRRPILMKFGSLQPKVGCTFGKITQSDGSENSVSNLIFILTYVFLGGERGGFRNKFM